MPVISIEKHELEVELPFHPGHVLTLTEAQAFNQYFLERLRRRLTKAAIAGESFEQLKEIADSYTLVSRVKIDPVVEEARKIARRMVEESLNKKGVSIRRVPAPKVEAAIRKLLDTRADITEMAKKAVAANNEVFDSVFPDSEAIPESLDA